MSKRFLVLLTLALLVLVEALQIKLKPRITPQQMKQLSQAFSPSKLQGELAPPIELQETSGQPFDLSEQVGKNVIVLNFFATWCGPCRDESPELERYYQAHRDGSFVFLAIDCNETTAKVQDYMRELHLTFPAAVDPGPVQKLYNVSAYPTTVLIGLNGRVQFYMSGAISNADIAFNSLLDFNRRLSGTQFAITRDAYLRLVKPSAPAPPPAAVALSGDRSRRIAARMPCPCGCDKRVAACACQTARKIEAALAREKFANQTDAQIMTELNRKYCMAGM